MVSNCSSCSGQKPNNPVTLMYGDEAGSITMFQFLSPLTSLFVSMKKDHVSRDNVQLILYSVSKHMYTYIVEVGLRAYRWCLQAFYHVLQFLQNLSEHSSCVRTTYLFKVHSDWVRKIMYLPCNHSFISCSTCPTRSLIMRDVEEKRKPYIFRLMKVTDRWWWWWWSSADFNFLMEFVMLNNGWFLC